jgi:hypothetical protein
VLNVFCHATIIRGLAVYLKKDPRVSDIPAWLVAFLIFFFPFHNVFFAAYAESLYLALTVTALLQHQARRLGTASVLAGIASWVRLMGVFLAVGLLAEQLLYSVRDRRIYWRNILLALTGVAIVAAWHIWLRSLSTDAVTLNASWIDDLMKNHVPPGENAKWWVFKYLSFSPRYAEVITFWASVAAILYTLWRRRYAEMFYIAAFNLSLVVYLYRPFPWTRYASVLFPVQIMIADWLKDKPRLAAAVVTVSAGSCYLVQRKLFGNVFGEP